MIRGCGLCLFYIEVFRIAAEHAERDGANPYTAYPESGKAGGIVVRAA